MSKEKEQSTGKKIRTAAAKTVGFCMAVGSIAKEIFTKKQEKKD